MHLPSFLAAAASVAAVAAGPIIPRATTYVGYLISTFTDAVPAVQMYLSNGNTAASFTKLNGDSPVLTSSVGTKAVRDIFLATNTARSEFYLLGTGEP